jgi:hypothetical protein
MGHKSESARSRARQLQLELEWEERIRWEELPAEIRLQVREELTRLLIQVAVGADAEVDDDDGER